MSDTPFRTLKGYERIENNQITHAMEDYLEMICRHTGARGSLRLNRLAEILCVRPSSASKMVGQLRNLGLVDCEKYGVIRPTEKGAALGAYLLRRHQVIHEFFCFINHSEDELEQTEKVEHFINDKTLHNMEEWLSQVKAEFPDSSPPG